MAAVHLFLVFILASGMDAQPTKNCIVNSVCFAIDTSGSIGPLEYIEEKDAVLKIARTISKTSKSTVYSAYGFSSSATLIQGPTPKLEAVFVPAVKSFKQPQGGTNIASGLSGCFSKVKAASGNRIIVLLTDGQDGSSSEATANSIKAAGVKIVTVGIGSGVAADYLRSLATRPKFYTQTRFGDIVKDAELITRQTCEAAVAPVSPAPQPTKKATPTPMSKKPSPKLSPKPTPKQVAGSCQRAYKACGFAFAGAKVVPMIVPGKSGIALSSRIVSRTRGELVGIVNKNGVYCEVVRADGSTMPIRRLGLPYKAFKPFRIAKTRFSSGIGHQALSAVQIKKVRGGCVRVFFSEYQTLRRAGKRTVVGGNKFVSRKANKCVVFRVK